MKALKSVLTRFLVNPVSFFTLVFLVTLLQSVFVGRWVRFGLGEIYPYFWLFGFSFLAFNVSLIFVHTLYFLFTKNPALPGVPSVRDELPQTAFLVCVKNEGDDTLERIRYSLEGNLTAGVHFWLLSDSSESEVKREEGWVAHLEQEFGGNIFYRRRSIPYERKQGNLADWFDAYGDAYQFLFISDADSLIPEGTLKTLLRKALHPANQDIGIFQSAIYIAHEHSLFSRMQAIGQFYAQKLYFRVSQAVFGRSVSFGHNQLVRSTAFRRLKLPAGVLSHDNWDTALLDRAGFKTAFVADTVTFEEATQNYLEERARTKRWMKGSLQGWPICFMNKISFATRFFIFYQIYLYLMHPILLLWILLGFLGVSPWFQIGLFSAASPQEMSSLWLVLWFTVAVLYGHKFVLVRSRADAKRISFEVVLSTLVSLNNILYVTLDMLSLPFEKLHWRPMNKNPNQRVSFLECARTLSPGTCFGLLLFSLGFFYSPYLALTGVPLLASLIFSIPVIFISARDWTFHTCERVPVVRQFKEETPSWL